MELSICPILIFVVGRVFLATAFIAGPGFHIPEGPALREHPDFPAAIAFRFVHRGDMIFRPLPAQFAGALRADILVFHSSP